MDACMDLFQDVKAQMKSPPKAPTYSAMGATPRSRTSTPPQRTTIDPWRLSPSSRAEPFILAGFTSSDFPDVEAAILPKGKAKITFEFDQRYSYTAAGRDWCFVV